MMRRLKPILLLLNGFVVAFLGNGCQYKETFSEDRAPIYQDSILIHQQLTYFQDSISLLPFIYFLPDTNGNLTFHDVARKDIASDFIKFPSIAAPVSSKNIYWFTLEVTNPDTVPRQWVLFLGYEQQAEVFGLDEKKLVGTMVSARGKIGAVEPGLFLRDEGYSGQVMLELDGNETRRLYIRAKRILNNPLRFDIKLFNADFWKVNTEPYFRHFGQGFFQGIIWALILYHLIFFIMVRDITYIHYSAYMVCVSMLTLGDFGYWQGFLFKNQPYLGWGLFLFLQYLTGIMTFVFMQSFVQLKRLMPKWNDRVTRFIWANIAMLLLLAILYLITRDFRVVQFGKLLIVPFALFGIIFCYLLIRSRDTVALYFAVAGGVFGLAILVNGILQVLSTQSVFIGSPYTPYYILQISAVAHLMTFAVGMGFRRRQIDLEKQRVVELDKMKTRLYTNITHEFRTPLTVIMGMNDQIKGYAQETKLIRRNSQNLLRLINQLLDLSKLDSGKLQLNKINNDIISYLQYLTESFHSMAAEKGVRLTFYSEEPAIRMDYDEAKIQHIVYNLLSNAIKFTEANGKVVFHVRREMKGETPHLQMLVQDSGVGISKAQLPHIFDRFYQADDSLTRKGEGTGIGLALTKELVDLMDGEISVTSELGQGTVFKIWLPITDKATKQKETKTETVVSRQEEEAFNTELPALGNGDLPLLLLIEDNPDVVLYIQKLLQATYNVQVAANGQIGIDKAYEIIPDIIISDVMMPEKDGYEVCETLKGDERTSHIPIILLTAKATEEDRIEGLKYGADAYLTKPFNKEELQVRLEKLVALRRQLQAKYAQHIQASNNESAAAHPLEDEFLQKLRAAVEEKLDDADFGVPELAGAVHMSQMQVYRKLKALTDQTPSQLIRSIRLQRASELLKNSDLTISEIAYDVGFTDPNYFSRAFQQEFGTSPRDFRN